MVPERLKAHSSALAVALSSMSAPGGGRSGVGTARCEGSLFYEGTRNIYHIILLRMQSHPQAQPQGRSTEC